MSRGVSICRAWLGGVPLTCGAVFAFAARPAFADGPCGQDYTGPTACAINTASVHDYDGTIVANNDVDYYVMYAAKSTHLSLSITDRENPACSNADFPIQCGEVSIALYDSQGNEVGGPGGGSSARNGITVPLTWSTIISSAGTYYLEVSGDEGSDSNGNSTSVPYDLNVAASPNVEWPAPIPAPAPISPPAPARPACVVPKYGGASLNTVKKRIKADHCTVGKVRGEFDKHVRRGQVISLSVRPGRHLRNQAPVGILVSKGRR